VQPPKVHGFRQSPISGDAAGARFTDTLNVAEVRIDDNDDCRHFRSSQAMFAFDKQSTTSY